MREELISFETAKLAKEKGYDISGTYMYTDNGTLDCMINISSYQLEHRHKWFQAPTQALLQKWLRERHNIDIEIQHFYPFYPESKVYDGTIFSELITEESDDAPEFDTYEQALEDCLQDALNLIK